MQHNRFQVSGYLAAKPEIRFLPSGTKVANARLGESYRFKGKDQKFETHTNWHRLTFYNELADLAASFEQGDNLFVEGSLQQRQFTPADGSKRTVSEIVVKSCHLILPSRNGHSEAEGAQELVNPEKSKTDEAFEQNWPL
ncbi:MAG TPA: single-stranded DNA-binding protein [Bryobacteraceae bacterium]|jgi:single-strand DNA-binding protein|nr:single-stranded DNA-binding protein [Bryobacteraceae bacterium]